MSTGTPRTDEACVSREYIAREMDIYAHKFVLADVARTLERSLTAAEAERDALRARVAGLEARIKGYDVPALAYAQRESPGPFGGPGTPNALLAPSSEPQP